MFPFQALYGYLPPHLAFSSTVATSVVEVESYLKQRDDVLSILKDSLHKSQERMKRNLKLAAKYYGPFEIVQKIGLVAYKIQLPAEERIHHVFHVSQLKQHVGTTHIPSPALPVLDTDGQFLVIPATALASRTSA
ncbi:uncharacterized protein LOC113306136 [Papaver somniferum]|uniref:uncharacterized protein LOC113306136 n=1 Tax=Papaver somniferum TaxID=3469 RepID=UPI000E6FD8DE|nr:uncharacterized protein LOC113306136 [Papaver somniferum]